MKVLLHLNTILTNSLQNPEFTAVQTVTNRNERNIYLFEEEEKNKNKKKKKNRLLKFLTTLVLIFYSQLLFNCKVHYESISKPLCFHIRYWKHTSSPKIVPLTVTVRGQQAS